jgi:hypothetical protein
VSAIAPLTIDENTSTPVIPFTVQDVETPAEGLNVVADSSNTNLVPVGSVMLSGTGTNRTAVVSPATNRFGATTITLTVTDTNGGAVMSSFELTVRQVTQPPVLTSQPQGLTVTNGELASFTVTATGTPPISFQWRRNGTDVPGGTNATLSLASVQASDAGNYSVLASNPAGQVTSAPAVLRVLVSPTITAIELAGASAKISFSTEAGLSYTVEFKNTPDAPAWTALGPVAGTGGVVVVTDAAATASSRIYRVRVE